MKVLMQKKIGQLSQKDILEEIRNGNLVIAPNVDATSKKSNIKGASFDISPSCLLCLLKRVILCEFIPVSAGVQRDIEIRNGIATPAAKKRMLLCCVQNSSMYILSQEILHWYSYEEILISVWYGSIIQLDKLEFGGQWPLTMRYGLRQSNKIISRPVTSFRSAHGIRQT